MKLKYIILCIILILSINNVNAAILTSSANPSSIFKCGESIVSATFNDAGILSVDAIIASTKSVSPMIPGSGRVLPETQSTVVPMAFNGTYWVGTFGDDSNLLWGTRSITYLINDITSYSSSQTVFVYNNVGTCTGTGKNSYQNYTSGIGNYTNLLVKGNMPIYLWALYPWIQYWGYLFYVIVMSIVIVTIYMKTQNVMSAILTALICLVVISGSGVIDISYRSYILSLIALCLAAVFYRMFVRE